MTIKINSECEFCKTLEWQKAFDKRNKRKSETPVYEVKMVRSFYDKKALSQNPPKANPLSELGFSKTTLNFCPCCGRDLRKTTYEADRP